MATTPNDREGLKKYISDLKAQGKTESTSKSLAKAVIKLKQFTPEKFDLEAGGGNEAILQRGVEDPTPEIPGLGAGAGTGSGAGTGISGSGFGASSSGFNLQQIYDQAMNSPEVQELQSELTAKKEALTEAVSNINDNPFYSEATRTGRIAKLEDRANREIGDLQDQLNLKQADAQTRVNIATQQYNINNQEYQNQIQRLNLLISSGALLNASSSDIANISVATGLSTSMVQGIKAQMQRDQVAPQVITSTDNAGNVTVAVVDGNTGNIISQNSLGAIGKANVGKEPPKPASIENLQPQMIEVLNSQAGSDGYISPHTWGVNLKAWLAERQGQGSIGEYISLFGTLVNPSHSEDYFGYDAFFDQEE